MRKDFEVSRNCKKYLIKTKNFLLIKILYVVMTAIYFKQSRA